jgi:hypothetical protein
VAEAPFRISHDQRGGRTRRRDEIMMEGAALSAPIIL